MIYAKRHKVLYLFFNGKNEKNIQIYFTPHIKNRYWSMNTKNKVLSIIYLIFSFVGMYLSLLLLFEHLDPNFKSSFMQNVCGAGGGGGCTAAKQSSLSTLFGFPVALWGFLFYTFVALVSILFILLKTRFHLLILFIFTSLALVADAVFFAYSLFALDAICFMCMLTWITTLILEITIVTQFLKENKKEKLSLKNEFNNCQKAKTPMKLTNTAVILLMFAFTGFMYKMAGQQSASSQDSIGSVAMNGIDNFLKKYEALKTIKFDSDDKPIKGSKKAVVTIVEFSDFLCPFCSRMGNNLNELMKSKFVDRFEYSQLLNIVFRHYPLDTACNKSMRRQMHPGACLLAYASYCAYRQDKFWDMHNLIYAKQDEFYANQKKFNRRTFADENDVKKLADVLNLNKEQFSTCLNAADTKSAIQRDIKEANDLHITGTPTLFVNGKKLAIFNSYASLVFYIEQIAKHEAKKMQEKFQKKKNNSNNH